MQFLYTQLVLMRSKCIVFVLVGPTVFMYVCVLCPDVEGKGRSPAPSKQPRYQLGKEQRGAIKADTSNKKMWDHLLTTIRTVSHLSFYLLTLLFLWYIRTYWWSFYCQKAQVQCKVCCTHLKV